MQSQPEAPERMVLTSPLGSRCGSQGHREAVTEDLCGAGGLALCSLPGTSVPLTSQGAWLHLRPEDNGGGGLLSLRLLCQGVSLEESSVSPGIGVLGRGAPRFS